MIDAVFLFAMVTNEYNSFNNLLLLSKWTFYRFNELCLDSLQYHLINCDLFFSLWLQEPLSGALKVLFLLSRRPLWVSCVMWSRESHLLNSSLLTFQVFKQIPWRDLHCLKDSPHSMHANYKNIYFLCLQTFNNIN